VSPRELAERFGLTMPRVVFGAFVIGGAWIGVKQEIAGKASDQQFQTYMVRDSAWKHEHLAWSETQLRLSHERDSLQTERLTEALPRLSQVICKGQTPECR
jgi:hypothetical protein